MLSGLAASVLRNEPRIALTHCAVSLGASKLPLIVTVAEPEVPPVPVKLKVPFTRSAVAEVMVTVPVLDT